MNTDKRGKNMKKTLVLLLALALCLSLVTACSTTKEAAAEVAESTAEKPQTETAENSAEEAPADDTVYTLVASSHTPSTATMTTVFRNMLDEITARSNGRIQFDVYTDGTLAAADGILDAIESGIADVACVNYSRVNGRLDLCGVMALPGVFSNSWEGSKAFLDIYADSAELQKQFSNANVHLVSVAMGAAAGFLSTDPVNTLEDISGRKVIISNNYTAEIITKLGATPLSFSGPEAYEALSKGTADAWLTNLEAAAGFGAYEIAKNYYSLSFGVGPQVFVISQKVYESLPEDLQQIIDEVGREFVPDDVYVTYTLERGKDVTSQEVFEEAGTTFVTPSEAEMSAFQDEYASATWDEWAADQGDAGSVVLDAYLTALEGRAGTCPEF